MSIPHLKTNLAKKRKLLNNISEDNINQQQFDEKSSKRLICDCGVSFVAEETLNGHKKYYCKNRNKFEELEIQHNKIKKVHILKI